MCIFVFFYSFTVMLCKCVVVAGLILTGLTVMFLCGGCRVDIYRFHCNAFVWWWLQGKGKEEVMKIRKSNLIPGLLTFYKDPVFLHQGHMQYLWDTSGKRYLDLFAGIVTVSVGHCHP
jgi:hypothetical protein